MALIKLSSNLDAINGSIGNITYTKVRSGTVSKTKSEPGSVNPFTPSQSQIEKRNFFKNSLTLWKTLTDAQVRAWNALAKTILITNIFGETYYGTGFNLFLEFNQNIQIIGGAAYSDAPTNPSVKALTDFDFIIFGDAPITFTLNFTGHTTNLQTKHIIYATPCLSAGKSYAKNKFRKVGILPASTANSYEFYSLYNAIFPQPTPAKKIIVRLRPIDISTGFAGSSIVDYAIVPTP